MTSNIRNYNLSPQQQDVLRNGFAAFNKVSKSSKNGEISGEFQLELNGKVQTLTITIHMDNPTADQVQRLVINLLQEAIHSQLGTKTKEIHMKSSVRELEITKIYTPEFSEQNQQSLEKKCQKIQTASGFVFSKVKKYKLHDDAPKLIQDGAISTHNEMGKHNVKEKAIFNRARSMSESGPTVQDMDDDEEVATVKRTHSLPEMNPAPDEDDDDVIDIATIDRSPRVPDSFKVDKDDEGSIEIASTDLTAHVASLQPSQTIGGIVNGGNSCYLNSALQVINCLPSYRTAFDPSKNPLKQRNHEPNDKFAQRKQIQNKGFAILNDINNGKRVGVNAINDFRIECYGHEYDGKYDEKAGRYVSKQKTVDSLTHTADAAETLERLLTVVDFKFPEYTFKETLSPIGQPVIVPGDPAKFDLLTEKATTSDATIELGLPKPPVESVFGALFTSMFPDNPVIPIQDLIDDHWSSEEINDFKALSKDDPNIIHEYKKIRKDKTPLADGVAPPLLRVTLKQPQKDKHKVIPLSPDHIYPFGKNGPEYKLKAVIQHFSWPSHYIAHIVQEDGSFLTANDDRVKTLDPESKKQVSGFVYYYELKTDSIASLD